MTHHHAKIYPPSSQTHTYEAQANSNLQEEEKRKLRREGDQLIN
jgi:hypothetical protein